MAETARAGDWGISVAGLSVLLMGLKVGHHEKGTPQTYSLLSERASELFSESSPSTLDTN
jgi:hypothetical protein